jgi:GNAT superfamily N-acetyltransferase
MSRTSSQLTGRRKKPVSFREIVGTRGRSREVTELMSMSKLAVPHGAHSEVTESIDQLASMWKVLVGDRDNAHIEDSPGMAIRWADSAFPFWNAIVLTDQSVDAEGLAFQLRNAAAYMRRKRFPGLIWVCDEYLDDGAKASLPMMLAEFGLEFALHARGMAGDFLPLAEPAHPALRFARVTTDAALQAYADINSEAYGLGLEAGRAGLNGSALWKHAMHTYLAYESDIPVSAAATVANGDCLFLALVATLPGRQRQGYAEATVRKALYEGYKATGLKRTVLHATDAGFPVYARLGYYPVANIRLYKLADAR